MWFLYFQEVNRQLRRNQEEDLEDLALIWLCKYGSDDQKEVALEDLAKKYIGMILSYAYHYEREAKVNDLVQLGLWGFYEAIRHFDPKFRLRFMNQARIYIKMKIIKEKEKFTETTCEMYSKKLRLENAIKTLEDLPLLNLFILRERFLGCNVLPYASLSRLLGISIRRIRKIELQTHKVLTGAIDEQIMEDMDKKEGK